MRPAEEIISNPQLTWKKSPLPDIIQGGILEFKSGKKASFAVSLGDGIEHVSVQMFVDRLPKWYEMCEVKDIFWDDEEDVVQVHPRKSVYVNLTEAPHLIRPVDGDWNKMMDMVARGMT